MTGDPERETDEGAAPAEGLPEPPPPTIAPSALRAATEERLTDASGPGDSIDLEVDAVVDVGAPEAGEEPEPGDVPEPSAAADEPATSEREVAVSATGDAVDVEADQTQSDETQSDETEPDEPRPDDPATQAWREVSLSTRIEALLFVATEPLSLRRLQTLCGGEEAGEVRDALASLDAHYEASGRAFSLVEIGGGYQLRTRSELTDLLAGMGRKTSAEKLSPAAVETLAIVAYRQPVLRVDVEKIRGVASGEVLRGLIEKGLVRVAGRADLPGSPLLYGTTPMFLELFGLKNVQDLPSDRATLRRPV